MSFSPVAVEAKNSTTARAKLFRGLADPTRSEILDRLRPGPKTVGAIVVDTGFTQSNVSNHLACLLDCGLVRRTKQGKFAIYALSDQRIESLLLVADELANDLIDPLNSCPQYGGPEWSH